LLTIHRETASVILSQYLESVGGKEALFSAWEEKKANKKRGRASTGTPQGTNGVKKSRKNGAHPASATPPAGFTEFKPPTGSWEEEVTGIDACEGSGGKVIVYLTWRGGHKSQHPLPQVYKRCPQKVRTIEGIPSMVSC